MKWLAVALLTSLTAATGSQAACEQRVLGEAPTPFLVALSKRLELVGVSGMYRDGPVENGEGFYVLVGSSVNVVIRSGDGMLTEVGSVVEKPSAAERDRQLTIAAFTISRVSGRDEREVKADLYKATDETPDPGSASFRRGDVVAAITRKSGSYVIKVGKYICK
jgi:hypothetical protein